MTSLIPPRSSRADPSRREQGVELTATTPVDPKRPANVFSNLIQPRYGCAVVAGGGALAVALAGWVLIAGLTVFGWLSADAGGFPAAIGIGSQLWLLTNGAGAVIDGVPVTLTPLGVSLLWVVLLGRTARVAARMSRRGTPSRITWWVTGSTTVGYAGALLLAVLLLPQAGGDGIAWRPGRALLGGVLLAGPIAWWQAARTTGYRPAARWPDWVRSLPRAAAAGLGVLLGTGAVALVASLVAHLSRVEMLWRALDAGIAGGVVLLVLQLALLPGAVVWATAYTLGSGFGLGAGSVVAPRAADVGLLPSLPLTGALPTTGMGSPTALAWLSGGVLAGSVAALLVLSVLRHSRPVRVDLAAVAGGLAGLLPGLLFVGLAALASGGLGSGRLAHLGPRLGSLAVTAPVVLGLAGLVTGALAGLVPLVGARLARRQDSGTKADQPDRRPAGPTI